jgi:hypothetical protein
MWKVLGRKRRKRRERRKKRRRTKMVIMWLMGELSPSFPSSPHLVPIPLRNATEIKFNSSCTISTCMIDGKLYSLNSH